MSKPITGGVGITALNAATTRASERANAYEGGLKACLKLAGMYRERAMECQRVAGMFDREGRETAHLLALALNEKWRLMDAGRGVAV